MVAPLIPWDNSTDERAIASAGKVATRSPGGGLRVAIGHLVVEGRVVAVPDARVKNGRCGKRFMRFREKFVVRRACSSGSGADPFAGPLLPGAVMMPWLLETHRVQEVGGGGAADHGRGRHLEWPGAGCIARQRNRSWLSGVFGRCAWGRSCCAERGRRSQRPIPAATARAGPVRPAAAANPAAARSAMLVRPGPDRRRPTAGRPHFRRRTRPRTSWRSCGAFWREGGIRQ